MASSLLTMGAGRGIVFYEPGGSKPATVLVLEAHGSIAKLE